MMRIAKYLSIPGVGCAALAMFTVAQPAVRADVISVTLTEESSTVLTASPGWMVTPAGPQDHWTVTPTPDNLSALSYLASVPTIYIPVPEPVGERPNTFNVISKFGPGISMDVQSDVPANFVGPDIGTETVSGVSYTFIFNDNGDVAPPQNNVPDKGPSALCLALGLIPLVALKHRRAVAQM